MIPIAEIRAAREAIGGGSVVRTPLIRLEADVSGEIWVKLENLQPIGSFKLRGALNAIRLAAADELGDGVVTASAGNMAQGVAWAARELGLPCTVVVPEHAPETKVAAVERLGGRVVRIPYERWWQAIVEARVNGIDGHFVHPVQDAAVIAGNATIGLEILEELPDVDAILIPYGGGGLTAGIASAVKALRPEAKIYPVEPATAAPLAASLAAGAPQEIDYQPSFVDGAGGRAVLPEMWPVVSELVHGSFVVSLDETADAMRVLAERIRVVAEGAGALPVAAALAARAGEGKVVCIVSGGNVDAAVLAAVLAGETPGQ